MQPAVRQDLFVFWGLNLYIGWEKMFPRRHFGHLAFTTAAIFGVFAITEKIGDSLRTFNQYLFLCLYFLYHIYPTTATRR